MALVDAHSPGGYFLVKHYWVEQLKVLPVAERVEPLEQPDYVQGQELLGLQAAELEEYC